jgi:heat-inducible transcriptional repressor
LNRPLVPGLASIGDFDARSREVFRRIVESYLATGEPVGSRALSRQLPMQLSPASIRNVMADLEALGVLASPHASAGRVPTQMGLRLFVDGLLEVGDISDDERGRLLAQVAGSERSLEGLLNRASAVLSGLSQCADLVVAPKRNATLKHIEFVNLEGGRALTVLVTEDGSVENRVIETPPGMTPSALATATNFLSSMMRGRTLEQACAEVEREMEKHSAELGQLTQALIEAGLATWSNPEKSDDSWASRSLIVRGQSNLLEHVGALQDLDRVRQLFDDLENRRDVLQLLELTKDAEGIRIFIGAESKLASLSGSTLVAAPYHDAQRKIIGAIAVIGPTRLNYARIIPMVDYTAKVVGELLSQAHA